MSFFSNNLINRGSKGSKGSGASEYSASNTKYKFLVTKDILGEGVNQYYSDLKYYKDLERGVPVVFPSRINLIRVGRPVSTLILFGDIEVPCAEACRPFRTGFTSIVDANGASDRYDEQRQHREDEREGRGATPPRSLHA